MGTKIIDSDKTQVSFEIPQTQIIDGVVYVLAQRRDLNAHQVDRGDVDCFTMKDLQEFAERYPNSRARYLAGIVMLQGAINSEIERNPGMKVVSEIPPAPDRSNERVRIKAVHAIKLITA